MTLMEVMNKADLGDIISHFYTNIDEKKVPTLTFVVARGNKLISVNSLTNDMQIEELCDNNWEIVNPE
ncbi:MAG: hypothetical protein NC222_06800 [Staphylococcus sp.]|nr:hypothetical protein [Staphylococcus sp.]